MQPLSLEERLARETRLAPREAVRIGTAIARLVEQQHRAGARTCLVSPLAVLLSGNQVTLAEGALAAGSLKSGRGPGEPDTASYLTPEELAGQSPDERTDVYRLGALLYHMLAGAPPPRPQPASRLPTASRLKKVDGTPSIHAVRRDVPRALDAAISRAMAHDPRDRFPRAAQLAEVLEDSLAQRLDHEPHSDRPSQMAIVDSWEFREDELRDLRKKQRGATQRKAILILLALSCVLAFLLLRT
jgi:hypothetical protein